MRVEDLNDMAREAQLLYPHSTLTTAGILIRSQNSVRSPLERKAPGTDQNEP